MLLHSIDAAKPSHTKEFPGIKKLVEEYHTPVNYTSYAESSTTIYFWATPLGKAITKEQMNIAVYLLKHGADLGEIVRDGGGKTIYDVIEQEAATSEYYQAVKRSADAILTKQQTNLHVVLEEFIPKRNHNVHDIINQYMFPSHKNPTKGAHVEKVRPSEGSVLER